MTKHTFLTLTPEQRQQLESVVRTGQHPARQQTRARILLLLDRSQGITRTDDQIAALLGCHSNTVGNVRRRFFTQGLQAVLTDKPMGPSAPRKMTGELEAQLTLLACSDAPQGHARWTHRLLADKIVELGYIEHLSHVTVGVTLKKIRSNPGRCEPGVSANPRRSS
jgi:transposase